jgi:hypothetical protein
MVVPLMSTQYNPPPRAENEHCILREILPFTPRVCADLGALTLTGPEGTQQFREALLDAT